MTLQKTLDFLKNYTLKQTNNEEMINIPYGSLQPEWVLMACILSVDKSRFKYPGLIHYAFELNESFYPVQLPNVDGHVNYFNRNFKNKIIHVEEMLDFKNKKTIYKILQKTFNYLPDKNLKPIRKKVEQLLNNGATLNNIHRTYVSNK